MMKYMKKKGLGLFLATFLVVFMASAVVCADGPTRLGPWQEVQTYVCVNDSTADEVYATTNVSTSTISPTLHRILGYSIVPCDGDLGYELVIGLYDSTAVPVGADAATAITTDYLFDEIEKSDDDMTPTWYPYPKALLRGLTVRQGVNTVVIVYYEKRAGQ